MTDISHHAIRVAVDALSDIMIGDDPITMDELDSYDLGFHAQLMDELVDRGIMGSIQLPDGTKGYWMIRG